MGVSPRGYISSQSLWGQVPPLLLWKKSLKGTSWATGRPRLVLCSPVMCTRLSMHCSKEVLELSYEINSGFPLLITPGSSTNAEAVKVKESHLLTYLENYSTTHAHYYSMYFCLFLRLYLLTHSFSHRHCINIPYFVHRTCVGITLFLHHFLVRFVHTNQWTWNQAYMNKSLPFIGIYFCVALLR